MDVNKVMVSVRLIPASVLISAAFLKMISRGKDKISAKINPVPTLLPDWSRKPLIVLELALGLGLLLDRFRRIVQSVAVLLFALGAGMFALVLAKGQVRTCDCFGDASKANITWRSVVRNIALLIPTAIYGVDVSSSREAVRKAFRYSHSTRFKNGLLVFNALLAAVFFFGLLKLGLAEGKSSEIRRKPLKVGDEIPRAIVHATLGVPVDILDVIRSRASKGQTVVIFGSSTCESCTTIKERIFESERAKSGILFVWIRGTKNPENPSSAHDVIDSASLNLNEYLDVHGALAVGAGIVGTPTAIIVDSSGVVTSRMFVGTQAVNDLLDRL